MSVARAIKDTFVGMCDRARAHGLSTAFAWTAHQTCYYYPTLVLGRGEFDGVNVFDREWDILVILDGARVDTMIAAAADRPWIEDLQTISSVGGMSSTWLRRTFLPRRDQLSDVAYITANPNTKWLFDEEPIDRDDFGAVDELWANAWDDDLGTVPARAVTDRVIAAHAEAEHEKVIGHYMQPHFPSIPDPIGSDISKSDLSWENSAWNQLKRGEISRERVMESFRANLDYVLDDVELLIENVDGAVAITSDHGNAAGEWGYFGHYDWPVKSIQEVPWIMVQATDSGNYDTELESNQRHQPLPDASVERRLEMLGYRT